MTKTIKLGTIGVLLALSLGANVASSAVIPAGTNLDAKQELTRNNGSETETLDPALAESVGGNNLSRDLFEGLTATDSDGKVVPGLAESWRQKDPTTWVFTLRKNAKWSNGDPITADDVVYGMQRFVDPKTASPYASTYGIFIVNGKEITDGKKAPAELGVTAIDKYTLEVKTPYPFTFMPELVSNCNLAPQPKAVIEKFGKDWTKPGNMVGNGAFVLKDWQVNSKIVLVKNPQYWDVENVQLEKVTYLPIEDGVADVKLFQSGENDWVYQLPPGTFEQYSKEMPNEIRNAPMLGLRYYSFYNSDPLLKDIRVRKALSMVIDRDILAEKITADGQVPAYSAIVRGTIGADVTTYDWAAWPMEKKVAEAKKLLKEAGVEPGTKIKFSYNTSEYHKKMAIFAASEWKKKLGLDTEMESMEFKVLLKKRHDKDYQIARNGWIADYNDATSFLALIQCGNDQNDNDNCNEAAEKLIEKGNQSQDPAERKQLFTEATKMIMDDYPMLPLLQYTVPRLVKSYVGGYSTKNALDRFRSKDLYIIQH